MREKLEKIKAAKEQKSAEGEKVEVAQPEKKFVPEEDELLKNIVRDMKPVTDQ